MLPEEYDVPKQRFGRLDVDKGKAMSAGIARFAAMTTNEKHSTQVLVTNGGGKKESKRGWTTSCAEGDHHPYSSNSIARILLMPLRNPCVPWQGRYSRALARFERLFRVGGRGRTPHVIGKEMTAGKVQRSFVGQTSVRNTPTCVMILI